MTGPARRHRTPPNVWRVRGMDRDGNIRFSRLLARRYDAFRVARGAAPYYFDVVVEVADLGPFARVTEDGQP